MPSPCTIKLQADAPTNTEEVLAQLRVSCVTSFATLLTNAVLGMLQGTQAVSRHCLCSALLTLTCVSCTQAAAILVLDGSFSTHLGMQEGQVRCVQAYMCRL